MGFLFKEKVQEKQEAGVVKKSFIKYFTAIKCNGHLSLRQKDINLFSNKLKSFRDSFIVGS